MSAALALVDASPEGGATSLGLVEKGISEESTESLRKAERLHKIDTLLKPWRDERRAKLNARARAAEIRGLKTRRDWYKARADALGSTWTSRAAVCGDKYAIELTCGGGVRDAKGRLLGCGQVRMRPIHCQLRDWCPECIERRRKKTYARMVPALSARLREERVAWVRAGRPWRQAPQLRLLTLTAKHGATLEETRERVSKAWPKWRRWLYDEIGYAPSYAGIWQTTDSTGGHPHMHVCIVLPFIPVQAMAAAWVQACDGNAEKQGLDLRTREVKDAARYIAKYVTATAIDEGTKVETAAAWVRTTYARRLVLTSRAFWIPPKCRARCDCGCTEAPSVRIVESPTYERGNSKGARAP